MQPLNQPYCFVIKKHRCYIKENRSTEWLRQYFGIYGQYSHIEDPNSNDNIVDLNNVENNTPYTVVYDSHYAAFEILLHYLSFRLQINSKLFRYVLQLLVPVFLGVLMLSCFAQLTIYDDNQTPVTMQTTSVMLNPILFGYPNSLYVILVYLLIGFYFPVFAGDSHGWKLLLNSGNTGYFVGFILQTLLLMIMFKKGWFIRRREYFLIFVYYVMSSYVVLFTGLIGFYILSFASPWQLAFVPFWWVEIVKSVVCSILTMLWFEYESKVFKWPRN